MALQLHSIYQFIDSLLYSFAATLLLNKQGFQFKEEINMLLNRKCIKKYVMLGAGAHHCLGLLDVFGDGKTPIWANVYLDGAFGGQFFTHEDVERSGFSCSIVAQEAKYLVFEQAQIHLVDGNE